MDGVPQHSFKLDSGGWDYGGYAYIHAYNPDINFDGYQDLEYIASALKVEVARYHVWNKAE